MRYFNGSALPSGFASVIGLQLIRFQMQDPISKEKHSYGKYKNLCSHVPNAAA